MPSSAKSRAIGNKKYISKIESLITDNVTSVDVAAALFEMMIYEEKSDKQH